MVLQQELCIEFPLTYVAIRLVFLVVLYLVSLETTFITENFATILAGSFLSYVHSPQVCDVLKHFHFWCRIEHFHFLAGMSACIYPIFTQYFIPFYPFPDRCDWRSNHKKLGGSTMQDMLTIVHQYNWSERTHEPSWSWYCKEAKLQKMRQLQHDICQSSETKTSSVRPWKECTSC